jgi:phosphatidate cytidylyltransferase
MSALVLAPIVLGAVWLGGAAFLGLLIIVGPLMALEWARLAAPDGAAWREQVTLTIGVIAYLLTLGLGDSGLALSLLLTTCGLTLAMSIWRGTPLIRPIVGFAYVGGAVAAFAWLRGDTDIGRLTIIWLLGVVWATDIGAYFVGRTIGGPKMAPKLSPNKTWSGLIGGMVSAAFVGILVFLFAGLESVAVTVTSVVALSIFAALVALLSQAGDVFESSMKRQAGVKDSGTIIPGHGGILDRVDGLMFAATFVALVIVATHYFVGWMS